MCLAAQVRVPAEMAELKAQLVEGVEVRARAGGIVRAIARASGVSNDYTVKRTLLGASS